MYAKFGKRVCDLVIGVVALPFVLLIIAVPYDVCLLG